MELIFKFRFKIVDDILTSFKAEELSSYAKLLKEQRLVLEFLKNIPPKINQMKINTCNQSS